jgi:hypothetical protein
MYVLNAVLPNAGAATRTINLIHGIVKTSALSVGMFLLLESLNNYL